MGLFPFSHLGFMKKTNSQFFSSFDIIDMDIIIIYNNKEKKNR